MRSLLIKSIFVALAFALASCGGESPEQAQQQEEVADDGIRTIEVYGTDDMRFVVREAQEGLRTGGASGQFILLEAIEAAPGEEIRIRLTTNSTLPPRAMSHNLAIVDLGTDVDDFARKSLQAADNNYISPEYEDQVIATTRMLGGGETDVITFTVPETTGEYDYVCTFPGHFAAGMVGKLIVQ